MTGSEKQIAWAEQIKERVLSQWKNYLERLRVSATDQPGLKADPLAVRELKEAETLQAWLDSNVFNQEAASFWIEERDTNWIQVASTQTRTERRTIR